MGEVKSKGTLTVRGYTDEDRVWIKALDGGNYIWRGGPSFDATDTAATDYRTAKLMVEEHPGRFEIVGKVEVAATAPLQQPEPGTED